MDSRLPSGMLVTALLRRMNDSGGMGMVLAKGDPQGGGILVIVIEADRRERVLERGIGPDGKTALIDSTPANDILLLAAPTCARSRSVGRGTGWRCGGTVHR